LEELIKTPVWPETLALKVSIKNGDDSWEEELLMSHHRLSCTHTELPTDEGADILEEWESLDLTFHLILLDRCGSEELLTFSGLKDQSVRYRSLSLDTTSNQLHRERAAAKPQDILNAALERKAEQACELLTHHYKTTQRLQNYAMLSLAKIQ
jgi:DNA-binding GntR family transcriptional regulator